MISAQKSITSSDSLLPCRKLHFESNLTASLDHREIAKALYQIRLIRRHCLAEFICLLVRIIAV